MVTPMLYRECLVVSAKRRKVKRDYDLPQRKYLHCLCLKGLQTYMSYSNSVLYAKSGGTGRIASLAIVVCTALLFVIGPAIASYLPRCMAGTLLLHIGIDLILEGVYDCKWKPLIC
jgi:hypothetical protein